MQIEPPSKLKMSKSLLIALLFCVACIWVSSLHALPAVSRDSPVHSGRGGDPSITTSRPSATSSNGDQGDYVANEAEFERILEQLKRQSEAEAETIKGNRANYVSSDEELEQLLDNQLAEGFATELETAPAPSQENSPWPEVSSTQANLEEATGVAEKEPGNEQECPICMQQIEAEADDFMLLCGHLFHRNCLQSWFHAEFDRKAGKTSCPVCRAKYSGQLVDKRDV